ncbi:MAG: MucB/RseB C-terminal domain-containing protein [Polaromonas sp.]|nr:MucB/RseB C-terminal domain-containing protein [Polaromonas sp.]
MSPMRVAEHRCWSALLGLALGLTVAAVATPAAAVPPSGAAVQAATSAAKNAEPANITDWLMRMHEASRKRSYVGTFVVSSGAAMSSARIWHVCQGDQQVERVETLTGPPRSVYRHNDQVHTFMPDIKVMLSERRESLGMFPDLLKSANSSIADFYTAKAMGVERVAGIQTDVVELVPKDTLRFAYRIWAEAKSGLVLKLETLAEDGQVLEQAAFSELQLDVPLKMAKLLKMMEKTDGYRVERLQLQKTTALKEGWVLKTPVPGFKSVSCYRRPTSDRTAPDRAGPVQWTFSDGLASVSLFIEVYDGRHHQQSSSLSIGATQTIARRLDAHWVTVMGEVPLTTLQLFVAGLERHR